MVINKDVIAIDESLNHHARVCKEIGRVDEQIEAYKADQYLNKLQGIDYEPLQHSINRLKKHRAELENNKQRAETDIYNRFEHYYS